MKHKPEGSQCNLKKAGEHAPALAHQVQVKIKVHLLCIYICKHTNIKFTRSTLYYSIA